MNSCIKVQRIIQIREKYSNAVLLPVITNNKLPLVLAKVIGMEVCVRIFKIKTSERKKMNAMERLLDKPVFKGRIKKGKFYIIVEDIVTQGGTVAALRRHIIKQGGIVLAVIALACSAGSSILAPRFEDVILLVQKFDYRGIIQILEKYHISNAIWELTKSQIRYLLRFKELKRIINKIHILQRTPVKLL